MIPTRAGSDKLIWVPNSRGVFTVKLAYHSFSQHVNTSGLCESFWKKLGKIKTPKRIKMAFVNPSQSFRFFKITLEDSPSPLSPSSFAWSPSPLSFIKINIDAAISPSSTSLAAIARDHNGAIIKVWMKNHCICHPIQAKVAALHWAVQLASSKGWKHVIFQGDSKECINTLTVTDFLPSWSISNITSNVLSLVVSFTSCSFFWVRRSCNVAAHVAAKYTLGSSLSFCFYKDDLPVALLSICEADIPLILSSF